MWGLYFSVIENVLGLTYDAELLFLFFFFFLGAVLMSILIFPLG